MRLAVISHKPCWSDGGTPSDYVTDGGFPLQMRAISELFTATTLVVPCEHKPQARGVTSLQGHNIAVVPLQTPGGIGFRRKIGMITWLLYNGGTILREVRRADAVHTPIPGDIGTIGMLLAFVLRKPLFVRHCGNWLAPQTVAERFWKWFMQVYAGGRNVMLATGGTVEPPSARNLAVKWIFSTSLTEQELTTATPPRTIEPHKALRLLIACRQSESKGTGRVIAAMPYVLADFPQTTLDVVGDGEYLPSLRKQAEMLGVAHRVVFHGKVAQPEVVQMMQTAHDFCFPTTASEGFPKVVLEALASGLPVVTTKVSVLPQLIGSGGGVLLDDVTPAAIAAAVRAIVMQPQIYQQMAVEAQATARHYSLEKWRDRIGNELQAAWQQPLN